MNNENMKKVARNFHSTVSNSFGKELASLRKRIKSQGVETIRNEDNEVEAVINKMDKPVSYQMPDNATIMMDYKIEVDVDGNVIEMDTVLEDYVLHMGAEDIAIHKPRFRTQEEDYAAHARKGFVNMIQATDALMARLIIVHAKKLGVKHIVAIHDCFRVSVHDTDLLQEAIRNAYMELFGTDTNEPTENLKGSLDIIENYMIGANNATKEEYKFNPHTMNQFTTKSGFRASTKVKGARITDLISSLISLCRICE